MPAQTSDLQHISIKDFTPGIADNPGSQYPPGQAQRTDTFRCICNRAGALVPMPARTVPFSLPDDAGHQPSAGGYAIIGLYSPPITPLPSPGTINPNVSSEHELFVGTEYVDAGTHHHFLRRYRIYESPGTSFDTIENVSFADALQLTPSGMGFCTTRSNRLTPTQPGHATVVYGYFIGVGGSSYIHEFPDDQALNALAPYVMETGIFSVYVVAHQGRVVVEDIQSDGHGPNTSTFIGENMKWWPVNDVTAANVSLLQVFVPENPSSGFVIASMSANELFVAKQNGGYYVVGDLANPTVVSLPMVVGTDVSQIPATTPIGVVYGNRRSGVWKWQHGDTATLLSPKMKPDFWYIDSSFGGVAYQFSVNDDWILAPNNWVFDIETGGWWRLEDPSVAVFRLLTSFNEYIYGSLSSYSHSNLQGVHRWQRSVLATSYSWRSQPFPETVDNYVDVQAISLRTSGKGEVTVTVINQAGQSRSTVVPVTSDLPTLTTYNLALKGDTISLKLESKATGTGPAPTIWEADLGYRDAEAIGRG